MVAKAVRVTSGKAVPLKFEPPWVERAEAGPTVLTALMRTVDQAVPVPPA